MFQLPHERTSVATLAVLVRQSVGWFFHHFGPGITKQLL